MAIKQNWFVSNGNEFGDSEDLKALSLPSYLPLPIWNDLVIFLL